MYKELNMKINGSSINRKRKLMAMDLVDLRA